MAPHMILSPELFSVSSVVTCCIERIYRNYARTVEGEGRVKNQFSSPISDQGPAAASFGLFAIVASSGFMSEEISASCALIRRSGLRWLWRTLTKPSGFRTSLLLGHQLHPLKPSLRHGSQPSGCSNGSSRLKFGRRVVEPEGEVKGSAATLRMSSRSSRVSRCPMGGWRVEIGEQSGEGQRCRPFSVKTAAVETSGYNVRVVQGGLWLNLTGASETASGRTTGRVNTDSREHSCMTCHSRLACQMES